jgi:hypothetical protein
MDNQADITVQTVATQGSHIQHDFKGTVQQNAQIPNKQRESPREQSDG